MKPEDSSEPDPESISEWEDLGDDHLSVRSLSDTEDEDVDDHMRKAIHQASSPIPIPIASPPAAAGTPSSFPPKGALRVTIHRDTPKTTPDEPSSRSSGDHDHAHNERVERVRAKIERLTISDDDHSHETILKRLPAADSALAQADRALALSSYRNGSIPTPAVNITQSLGARVQNQAAIKKLRGQVETLAGIVRGYHAVVNRGGDVPLDVDAVGAWTKNVYEAALQLELATGEERFSVGPGSWVGEVVGDIEKMSAQMAEFLPIIQTDFNDFQTETHGTNMIRLRRELYTIKDLLDRARQHLLSYAAHAAAAEVSPSQSQVFLSPGPVQQSLNTLSSALTSMLTNNPSEWIDSGIRGGITHAEFVTLDVELLMCMAAELREVLAVLDVDTETRSRDGLGFRGRPWTGDVRALDENRREVLVAEGGMAKLEGVGRVLGDLLKVG